MYFAKQDKRTPDVVKSQQPSNNASTTGQIHLKFWHYRLKVSCMLL